MGYEKYDEMGWYAAWGRGTLVAGVGLSLLMQGCSRQARPVAKREWLPETFAGRPQPDEQQEPLPEK